MKSSRRRNAFTLIEVLIVVVIMAVLAATIIPQFSSSTKDAKESSLNFNLHTMRSQIELYKAHHLGDPPDLTGDHAGLAQLTNRTDASGNISDGSDDTKFPFGPYMESVPANAFNSKRTVEEGTEAGGDDEYGWTYNSTTGELWPCHAGWEE